MSVLITGGAGYIGSTLIKRLVEAGYHVISIDNLFRGSYEHLKAYERSGGARLLIGDICDFEVLERAVKNAENIDIIFHLAAIPGVDMCRKMPERAILTNVYGSYNVLEVAREHDLSLIHISEPTRPY